MLIGLTTEQWNIRPTCFSFDTANNSKCPEFHPECHTTHSQKPEDILSFFPFFPIDGICLASCFFLCWFLVLCILSVTKKPTTARESTPYYTILYYTILYYTILYYTILYYTILYYTILYYTILYSTLLYSTLLLYVY